jgi:hypothetical protein
MHHYFLFTLIALFVGSGLMAQSTERRNQYLKDILEINIPQRLQQTTRRVTVQDSTWTDWLNRTGELPPDFSVMASVPFLPDPLVLTKKGKDHPVRSKEDWREKRNWIKSQYMHWISGVAPPPPPDFKVEVLSERQESGTRIQMLEIKFGPGYRGRMTIEVMIPPGDGPFPVYLTQWNHRGWAQLAVRRGYLGCIYAAADIKDDTDAYQALYPDYDWSALMRRAWGASRVVDYLLTRREVNQDQIAITGHSRNGKQSLWAAAFDERIAAVISSSSGTGGPAPWRYGDPQYASETLDIVTAFNGHWFHPRLRFFFGHEDRLPVDQNLLLSLIAPRKLLLHHSIIEHGINPWADEQSYQSAKKVYQFLGVPENIGVFPRMGEHAVAARDIERCIDFLDIQFKRSNSTWENNLYHEFEFSSWAKTHEHDSTLAVGINPIKIKSKYPDIAGFEKDKKRAMDNLQWLLGEEPPQVTAERVKPVNGAGSEWINLITGLPKVTNSKMMTISSYNAMGHYVSGTLYCRADNNGELRTTSNNRFPVVIFLHQYAHSTGIALGYNKNGWPAGNTHLFQTLVDKGFAVLAFDMMGFGTRQEEGKYFYERFPQWSKMGNMVSDVKASVDALETFDFIDPTHIFLLGNTIGGSVALMSAARDERIAGVAVVSAFSPWRTSNPQYESIRNYSHIHGFLPRLGYFANRPDDAPVDFAEIVASIAPRPLMIVAPELDRYADMASLKRSIESVKAVYNLYQKGNQFHFDTPHEINRMTTEMNKSVADFYGKLIE